MNPRGTTRPRLAPGPAEARTTLTSASLSGVAELLPDAAASVSENFEALLHVLEQTHQSLRALQALADQKLQHLRSADSEGLTRGATQEALLLDELLRCGQKRQAILARLAQQLHWPQVLTARLTQIAQAAPQPLASQILAKNAVLREVASALEKKNQLAARVARGLHNHVRAVLAELAKAANASVGYGRDGQHEPTGVERWIDAVG